MTASRMSRAGLGPLVRAHLAGGEDEDTARLIGKLRQARKRGYLRALELEAVCRWKSPRAIWQIRRNSAAEVRKATRLALRARDEEGRMGALLHLKGVAIPMASAALMLLDPRRYGVIDIRVWQLLHRLGRVSANRAGVGLRLGHWLQFLAIVRELAARLRATARQVERALFEIHRGRQRGTLYGRAKTGPRDPRSGRESESRGS
jgi:hypothetical protein